MRNRVCWMLSVVCLAIFGLSGSLGATVYHYEDLTLQGFSGDTITAINDSRWIVGYSATGNPTPYQAFVWRPGVGKTILQNLSPGGVGARAYGINNAGKIVGQVRTGSVGPYWACIWPDPGAAPTVLYWFSSTASSCAYGINTTGQITGELVFGFADDPLHAARWDIPQQTPFDLGTLGGETSSGRSINDAGRVVGQADKVVEGSQSRRPCLWVGQASTEIPMPQGAFSGSALAINSQGNVMGHAETGLGFGQAFFWNHQTGATQYICPDWYDSTAKGLSDANQVVGSGEIFVPSYSVGAFSWFPATGKQDLNNQVLNLPAGVTLNNLTAPVISPKGYISGFDSRGHAYLLTPIASPVAPIELLLLN
jgi:probable HAF family extracellular repeat protein